MCKSSTEKLVLQIHNKLINRKMCVLLSCPRCSNQPLQLFYASQSAIPTHIFLCQEVSVIMTSLDPRPSFFRFYNESSCLRMRQILLYLWPHSILHLGLNHH